MQCDLITSQMSQVVCPQALCPMNAPFNMHACTALQLNSAVSEHRLTQNPGTRTAHHGQSAKCSAPHVLITYEFDSVTYRTHR